jgi:hypothetical protein
MAYKAGSSIRSATCTAIQASALPWFGLLVFVAACGSSPSAASRGICLPPPDVAAINLGCVPSEPPVVKATGPCTVTTGDAETKQYVYLQSNDAGICHVELTFGSGAKSLIDVNFMSRWRAMGSDPHGCGQEFVAVNESGSPCVPSACTLSVPELMCDAGTENDAGR